MSEAALVYPRVLECPRCGIGLGAETISDASDTICPSCRAVFRATLFPLFWRESDPAPQRATLVAEGEATG